MTRRARKAWNGGTRETAMAAARQRTEEAIASGCPRCRNCGGDGGLSAGRICECCHGAGFFVPEGGMPLPRNADMSAQQPEPWMLALAFLDQSPSYAHGFTCGRIWEQMRAPGTLIIDTTVVSETRDQIEAMAMHMGWTEEITDAAPGWVRVVLTRPT